MVCKSMGVTNMRIGIISKQDFWMSNLAFLVLQRELYQEWTSLGITGR